MTHPDKILTGSALDGEGKNELENNEIKKWKKRMGSIKTHKENLPVRGISGTKLGSNGVGVAGDLR